MVPVSGGKTLRGDGMTVGEISSRAGQRLHGFFRCGDAVLTIREDGGDLDGRVKSSTETEISLRGQEPERADPFADSVGKCRVMEDTGWRFGTAGK